MCSFKDNKVTTGIHVTRSAVAKINGRPVLQPTCNRVPNLDRRNSFKNLSPKSSPSPPPPPPPLPSFKLKPSLTATTTPPKSPESKSPRPQSIKPGSELNSSSEKVFTPRSNTKSLERKKSKSFKEGSLGSCGMISSSASAEASLSYSSSLIVDAPGSIAAVTREQMALQHAQRKMRIAHYGRSKSAQFENVKVVPIDNSSNITITKSSDQEEKRCSFITPNSDPIYVAYHDEEWGVSVHDDNMLLELLVLSGAQVGSDWTSILKKRQHFRDAFSGFDAETVANFTDKQMVSISTEYNLEISRVRGVVDNSNRILKVKKEFGSFSKYIWGFVNHKPISTGYKFGHKIPAKTSKSESISKDMIRRGFRFVGPTVIHSFMQAAGLTNDHLITCRRHLACTLLASAPVCRKINEETVPAEQTL